MTSYSIDAIAGSIDVKRVQAWFEEHVTLFGEPYTLDEDQVRAVIDDHQNTLVIARAGSGKTRVIVAKVAYLVAHCGYQFSEIAVFMFNRTAAAEVNERIAAIKVDGKSLLSNKKESVRVASTFHKFALDLVKLAGEKPQILNEAENALLIRQALEQSLSASHHSTSKREFQNILGIIRNFINRAGQKFPGQASIETLREEVQIYTEQHCHDPEYKHPIYLHQLATDAYSRYLQKLVPPKTNFNLLMFHATEYLNTLSIEQDSINAHSSKVLLKVSPLRIIMVDEYQDFSYLFFSLIHALRKLTTNAKLFCVGDDWQAINRFAGSDVDYFINFQEYFLEDVANIPLATNYRSSRKIVEYANQYMLENYNPKALPAIPKSNQAGKVKILNPHWTKFKEDDIREDALGDGRYYKALHKTVKHISPSPASAQLLKVLTKLIKRHRKSSIMLLHRHNFTSFEGVDLDSLAIALRKVVTDQAILTADEFNKQIRVMTMHKSKGLEADVVILLEVNREIVATTHPHATLFEIFGDNLENERADQQRLLYVALTRAKKSLYILSSDNETPVDLTTSKRRVLQRKIISKITQKFLN